MAAVREDKTGGAEKISAAGITLRLYQPEEIEEMSRDVPIGLFLEEQAKLRGQWASSGNRDACWPVCRSRSI